VLIPERIGGVVLRQGCVGTLARMTTRPSLDRDRHRLPGATHAVCMAELGFEVLGLDVLPEKVEALSSGRVPFFEPGCRSCW
jgi:hypothetical protein